MRARPILIAGLMSLAVTACSAPERPTQLVSALYHGFTLVDANAGELTDDAWAIVVAGRVERQGSGTPPVGRYIAQFDLNGVYVLAEDGGGLVRLSDQFPNATGAVLDADPVLTRGLLREPANTRASINEGADTSSPNPVKLETRS